MMAIRPRDYGSRFIKTARWFSLRKPRLPIWRWTGLNAAKKVTFSGGKARGATFGCGITHYGFVISNIPLVPSRIVLEIDWRGLRLDEDTWSGSKVNRRIGEFLGQAVPSVHFAHSDLT